jgi:hypothetical protein
MLEQWHQKLHNNSSPDDVVICGALLAYIRAGLDEAAYWAALKAGGVTAERLASFDRPITAAPSFTPGEGTRGGRAARTAFGAATEPKHHTPMPNHRPRPHNAHQPNHQRQAPAGTLTPADS